MASFHVEKIDKVFAHLHTTEKGLREAERAKRLRELGYNRLPQKDRTSPIAVLLRQLRSWFIYVLLAAALLSLTFAKILDAGVIFAIIVMNALIGFFQERKAEDAIRGLQSLIVPKAKVLSEGVVDIISAEELVTGDVILLQAGDRVPADARIIHARDCSVNEASLTGETFAVEKQPGVMPEDTPLADRHNMLWMGTLVVAGTATAVVIATGAATALGAIATSISQPERMISHFHKKTNTLAFQLGIIAFVSAAVTFAIGFWGRGLPLFDVFIFSLATLVSSVPEALPAVLAVVLAIGAFRMAQRKAIVRHLPVIEDLSVTSVIMTDKTGTLTRNSMMVERIRTSEHDIAVSGAGWEPKGSFFSGTTVIDPSRDHVVYTLLHIAALCNNASVHLENGSYEVVGDPTEASFVVLAQKAGLTKEIVAEHSGVLDQAPFSQATRAQSVLVTHPERMLYAIGSEEAFLDAATHVLTSRGIVKLDSAQREKLRERAAELTAQSMRVVACAMRRVQAKTTRITPDLFNEFIFVGYMGISDPLRPEAAQAIADARKAGIRVIMVTGDHARTAEAIARNLGLVDPKQSTARVYTEAELRSMPATEFRDVVATTNVFARMTPDMKLTILKSLQDQGHIVAMIGDGVNDAPALKYANVGIAMGTIGTDVAREAADIVLSDDNFTSLIKAIEQGRLIFDNIRKTSLFMITTSIAEILTIVTSLIIGTVLPLTALQILWINLITDGIPNLALAAEGQHGDLLNQPPRSSKERILTKEFVPHLVLSVLVMSAVSVMTFHAYLPFGQEKARTVIFALMIFFQLMSVINMRSLDRSIFSIGLFSNQFLTGALIVSVALQLFVMVAPFTREAFGLTTLSVIEFIGLGVLSLSVIVCIELYKVFVRFRKHRKRMLAV